MDTRVLKSSGTNRNLDKIPFHPYFTFKDIIGFIMILIILILLPLFNPYILCELDNFIIANRKLGKLNDFE